MPVFQRLLNLLSPVERLILTTGLSKKDFLDKVEDITRATRANGAGLIGVTQRDTLSFRLVGWHQLVVPAIVFTGRVKETAQGSRIEGVMSFGFPHKLIAGLFSFAVLAMLGATLVVWLLSVFVGAEGSTSPIEALLNIVMAFAALVLICAIAGRILFMAHKPFRKALLEHIQQTFFASVFRSG